MVQFADDQQAKKLEEFRNKEEEDLAQLLSQKYGVPYVDLSGIPIDTDGLKLIPEAVARERRVASFNLIGKKVFVGAQSPGSEGAQATLKELSDKNYIPELFIVSEASLEKAWSRYKDISFAVENKAGLLEVSDTELETFIKDVKSIDEVHALIESVLATKGFKTSRIVEVMLAGGLALKASDIHIEPEEKAIRIRMRIDGILAPIIDIPPDAYRLMLSRIKLISGLKLNVKDAAQDGRFSIHLGGFEIEIRTSVIPGNYGESIVMRILNPDAIQVGMQELGMEPELLAIVERQLKRPNGMILNTGPTGSGKTTTLYAFLRGVKEPGIKIITIEDPIEYHLDGVVQTQVGKDTEYDFASGLRAALRQDPDVIMVGEIRDTETAQTAVHAALTGHLVFSTLHTNNAAGTFARLADLGVDRSMFGSSLNIAMAQRLVRQLCPECKQQVPLDGEYKRIVDETLAGIYNKEKYSELMNPTTMWAPGTDCKACGGLGYKGRIGIFEAIVVDESIEEMLRKDSTEHEVQRAARSQGILNLKEDGIIKVLRGVTSMAELERVIDLW